MERCDFVRFRRARLPTDPKRLTRRPVRSLTETTGSGSTTEVTMSVSIPRFFGNRASLQPGQTDAPAGPPSTTPAPADDAKTRGGRFIGRLKQVARRKPVTPVPATTKPNDKLRSAAVSATAYRAGEFFDAHKNSAQTLPQLKLAAAGLECRGNTGESMRMSFAHALI